MDVDEKSAGHGIKFWKRLSIALAAICLALIIALIIVVLVTQKEAQSADNMEQSSENVFPCPVKKGGLVTSGDPESPSPFYSLTIAEHERLYVFLRQQQKLNLAPPDKAGFNTSNIFIVDLLMPPKQELLSYLDKQGMQPPREARVMIFRGDKTPPLVEE